jgi:uncharacterized protein (DUF1697 family)
MPEKKTYVAMLRGINVGGNKRVVMADLRAWLEEMGLKQVRTYVQSGNVVFQSDQPRARLVPAIEKKIEQRAGFPVRVMVRSAEELKRVLQNNPFLKRAGIEPSKLHVTFLREKAGAAGREKLLALPRGGDDFEIIGSEMFLHCPNGYGSSRLGNNVLEKAAGEAATTRNWRTVNALCSMCEEHS